MFRRVLLQKWKCLNWVEMVHSPTGSTSSNAAARANEPVVTCSNSRLWPPEGFQQIAAEGGAAAADRTSR